MTRKYENHFYNKTLQPYANRLRKEMTKAEACLCLPVGRQGNTFYEHDNSKASGFPSSDRC